jgi:hypothetical protein
MRAAIALATLALAVAPVAADDTVIDMEDTAEATVDAEVTTSATQADAKESATVDSVAESRKAAAVVPELRAGSLQARFFGSVVPTVGVGFHGDAVANDRWAYGVTGSRVDIGMDAAVGAGVSAAFYMMVAADKGDDGRAVGKVGLERAVIAYAPVKHLRFVVGRDSVPLSAQSATPTPARLFPTRIVLNDTFNLPADVGAQTAVETDRISAFAGVWNGIASDAMLEPGASERGLLYSARVEATPLGAFRYDEGNRAPNPRLGIGLAATYRAATAFTPTGMSGVRSRDLRASISLRFAWKGVYLQTEALRRQITDDLSRRPDVATAGYVQASWRFKLQRIDVAPLARAGVEKVRQLSAPATGSSVELGAAVFPLTGGSDRLQVSAMFSRIVDPDLQSASLQALTQLRLGF